MPTCRTWKRRGDSISAHWIGDCRDLLRECHPEWGVRDIDDGRNVAEEHAMMLAEIEPMPANNLILIFERRGRAQRDDARR
jgi:hypothetical protein